MVRRIFDCKDWIFEMLKGFAEPHSPIWKILYAIDRTILEEGYRLYNMTLWHLRAKQKSRKIRATLYNWKNLKFIK